MWTVNAISALGKATKHIVSLLSGIEEQLIFKLQRDFLYYLTETARKTLRNSRDQIYLINENSS